MKVIYDVGKQFLIIGGRHGPSAPLKDSYLLSPRQDSWSVDEVDANGAFPGLFRHSAIATSNFIIVFGGCASSGLQNSTWKLNVDEWTWELAETSGRLMLEFG